MTNYKFKDEALNYEYYKEACKNAGLEMEFDTFDYIRSFYGTKKTLKVEESERHGLVRVTTGTKQRYYEVPATLVEEIEEDTQLSEKQIEEESKKNEIPRSGAKQIPKSGTKHKGLNYQIIGYSVGAMLLGVLFLNFIFKDENSKANMVDSLKTDVLIQKGNAKTLQTEPTKRQKRVIEFNDTSEFLADLLDQKDLLNEKIRQTREKQSKLYQEIYK